LCASILGSAPRPNIVSRDFDCYRYILLKHGTDHHPYCQAAAAVFIFGWMHTITYVKLFKDWHAFASIFKQIVAKDVTKFAYIFVFVLLRLVKVRYVNLWT